MLNNTIHQSIQIQHFNLSQNGLHIIYNTGSTVTCIQFDAFATCDLFMSIGIVEGFDTNGYEPVILYEHPQVKPYGWVYWSDFIQTFPFDIQLAQQIALQHYNTACSKQTSAQHVPLTIQPKALQEPPSLLIIDSLHNHYKNVQP